MRITQEDIEIRFDKYNKLYFGGCLPPCKCHRSMIKAGLGLYKPTFKNGKLTGHIWITYCVDWTEEQLREVIVHEMIHHYVQAIEGHKGGLFGHNWRFRRQCKRLKKEYGLNIRVISYDIYYIGEKKPKTLFQRLLRRVWG